MKENDSMPWQPISERLQSPQPKSAFLNALFDLSLSEEEVTGTDDGFRSFFDRLDSFCRLATHRNREIGQISYSQLYVIAAKTQSSHRIREDMIAWITSEVLESADSYLASILLDLTASVCSLTSIGKFPGDISYDEPVEWENGKALHTVISSVFSPSETRETVKLPQSFTAANLEKIAGIQVRWTNNLADHLLLRDDDTKVMIYHQVSALQLHKYSQTSVISPDLADETIRSISLLVPPVLGELNPWFRKEQQKHNLDAQAGLCDRLNSSDRQINNFPFWRDRLVLLKRTYDETEPKTLAQLWWDDRKKTQWFTFWVAVLVFIMTVFFGVIQSVASIVQAWASVKSLKAQ